MTYEEMRARQERWNFIAWCAAGASLILTGIAVLFFVAKSDGRADFCYVHTVYPSGLIWELESHRPWRSDMSLGYATSMDQIREMADRAGCKLHTEEP